MVNKRKTNAMIKALAPQPMSVGGEPLVIPNHSGQHEAGRIDNVKERDNALINKKYVDDADDKVRDEILWENFIYGGILPAVQLKSGGGWINSQGFLIEDQTAGNNYGLIRNVNGIIQFETPPLSSPVTWKFINGLSSNSNKIIDVADPTADQDAATKAYTDTGDLWESDSGEARLKTAEPIDMQSEKITSLANPTADQDAVTKKYYTDNLPSAGIANVVEDTSPQLGGNLDCNGKDIKLDSDDCIFFKTGDTGNYKMYYDSVNDRITIATPRHAHHSNHTQAQFYVMSNFKLSGFGFSKGWNVYSSLYYKDALKELKKIKYIEGTEDNKGDGFAEIDKNTLVPGHRHTEQRFKKGKNGKPDSYELVQSMELGKGQGFLIKCVQQLLARVEELENQIKK